MTCAIITIASILLLEPVPGIEFSAVSPRSINGVAPANPQGLAVNPRTGEFLVADALNDRVVIFDSNAVAVFSFALGAEHHNPFGIAVNSQDEIFISPMDTPSIWVYDYGGRYLNSIDLPSEIMPGRMIFDKADRLFLVNRSDNDIVELDKLGEIVRRYSLPDSSCKPSGVCLDNNGGLVLISYENDVVSAFNPDGTIAYRFGDHGRKLEDFSHPTSAACDSRGRLWVVDSFRHHVKRFDAQHKFIDILGLRGTGDGEFYFPVDIKISPGNKLGILEKGSGRLQIFRINDAR